MRIRNPLTKIKDGATVARKLAAKYQKSPLLSVALVDFGAPCTEGKISTIHCGFYKAKSRILAGNTIHVVWVKIDNQTCDAQVMSYGEYSPDQLKEISDFTGADDFFPEPLNLDQVTLDANDVFQKILENPISSQIVPGTVGVIQLNLQTKKGKTMWDVQQESPHVGFRRMTIDAHTGKIVFEKTD